MKANVLQTQAVQRLQQARWIVRPSKDIGPFPQHVLERHPWVPQDIQSFLCHYDLIFREDENAWLLLACDFRGESESAFAWNEWELQSLIGAEADAAWRGEIQRFWDAHMPIAFTVDDGYAYYALRSDNAVVYGREPEYEETEMVAASYQEFLELLAG